MKEILIYIFLGIIQGFTEPLPISSSGHVFIFKSLFKIKENNLNIEIFSNFGSLLAIIYFYIKDIKKMIKDSFNKNFSYIFKLIISVIPIGIIGIIFFDYISKNITLFNVGISLIFTSLLLLLTNKLYINNNKIEITYKDSLYIGIIQSFSILPGISRSGLTTSAGLINKIKFDEAIKFSFFIYIPISLLSFLYLIFTEKISLDFLNIVVLVITSFVTTLISLKLFFKFVRKNKIIYFSIYCFTLGLILIIL